MRSITVVGASLAGVRATVALRRAGFTGAITVIGDEQVEPYDRPPLTKHVLAADHPVDGTRLLSGQAWRELDVDWRLGVAALRLDVADRHVVLDNGDAVEHDGLVIATGARPKWLPAARGLTGVYVVRTLDDTERLRAELVARRGEVVVLGAGFIGTEVAAACRSRGLSVTLVDPLSTPLGRVLPPVLGEVVAGLHREQGVQLRTNAAVDTIETDDCGRAVAVLLGDGTRLRADVVVLALGVIPNVEWLTGSGLNLDDGVVCDATCLAAPGIVAAGDVACWPSRRYGQRLRVEHWTHAVEQAEYAARRLLVETPAAPFDPVPYVWSDQYDSRIQMAGRVGPDDELLVVDGRLTDRRFVAILGRDGEVGGVFGMNRPAVLTKWRARLANGVRWREAVADHLRD
jgi:3-phenylpropionate/trans-cinnamate dioxygenase ferredoxin reductase component